VTLNLNSDACKVLYLVRHYDQAIGQCRHLLEMDPNFKFAHVWLYFTYFAKGMYPQARAEAQRLQQLEPGFFPLQWIGCAFVAAGDRKTGLKYKKLADVCDRREYVPAYGHQWFPLSIGDHNEAVRWLEQAYVKHEVGLIGLKVDPGFDALRGERRFEELVRKMNFPLVDPHSSSSNIQ